MATKKTATQVAPKPFGDNVAVHVDDEQIVIRIDRRKKGRLSKSGQSNVLASTRGNKPLGDTGLSLGVNCYSPVG